MHSTASGKEYISASQAIHPEDFELHKHFQVFTRQPRSIGEIVLGARKTRLGSFGWVVAATGARGASTICILYATNFYHLTNCYAKVLEYLPARMQRLLLEIRRCLWNKSKSMYRILVTRAFETR
jgi:hypothetical protein